MQGWNFFRGNKRSGKTRASEPGAVLFGRLRLSLILWYSAILAGALLIFSIVLYLGVQSMLFSSVQDELRRFIYMQQKQRVTADTYPCPTPPPSYQGRLSPFPPDVGACYDASGQLKQTYNIQQAIPAFIQNAPVQTVLQTGQEAKDIIDAGAGYGPIYRCAVPIRDPASGNITGVFMAGTSVAAQLNALTILLSLLSTLGILLLLVAIAGGLFLSNRALQPARLAFARQQRFIADASHELRTPLTFLCADTELLLAEREHLREEDAELVEDIHTASTRMAALANNMLNLARLDVGDLHLHREHEVINLNDLALHTTRLGKALANKHHITLNLANEQQATVIGDPALLEQATLILLENAIKYNRDNGSVTLRVYTKDRLACLEVSDTGIGIAAKHLQHLGERFYRVDKSRSRISGGTGLGLSIARGIAIAHHGTLYIESHLNAGTTATLSFPLAHILPATHTNRA